jgi:hypothetical protein
MRSGPADCLANSMNACPPGTLDTILRKPPSPTAFYVVEQFCETFAQRESALAIVDSTVVNVRTGSEAAFHFSVSDSPAPQIPGRVPQRRAVHRGWLMRLRCARCLVEENGVECAWIREWSARREGSGVRVEKGVECAWRREWNARG